jgi:hypothetical protein
MKGSRARDYRTKYSMLRAPSVGHTIITRCCLAAQSRSCAVRTPCDGKWLLVVFAGGVRWLMRHSVAEWQTHMRCYSGDHGETYLRRMVVSGRATKSRSSVIWLHDATHLSDSERQTATYSRMQDILRHLTDIRWIVSALRFFRSCLCAARLFYTLSTTPTARIDE